MSSSLTKEDRQQLPAATLKKLDEAEKAEKKAEEEAEAAKAAVVAEEVPAPEDAPPPPEEKPDEPEVVPPEEPVEPVTPEPGAEEVVVETPGKESVQDQLRRLKDLEEELPGTPFKTLKGKYDAEVPRLHEEKKVLEAQVAELRARLTAAPLEPEVPPELSLLDPDEREAVSEEGDSIVLKQAKGVISAAEKKLLDRIEALEQRSTETSNQRLSDERELRETQIMAKVEEALPGADMINKSPQFTQWLDQPDPNSMTGATYGARGADVLYRGDVKGIEAILREGAAAIGLKLDGVEDGEPARVPPIKPAKQSASAPPSQTEKKMVKESTVLKFFNDQNAPGGLRHNDGTAWTQDEIRAKEKEFDQAEDEGRILQGK